MGCLTIQRTVGGIGAEVTVFFVVVFQSPEEVLSDRSFRFQNVAQD